MSTLTITDFLEARISEDEAVARAAIDTSGWGSSPDGRWCFVEIPYEGEWPRNPDAEESAFFSDSKWSEHATRHDPSRVLAECAAKRAIIEQADEANGLDVSVDMEFRVGRRDEVAEPYCGDLILRALAAVYSSHDDYDSGWAL